MCAAGTGKALRAGGEVTGVIPRFMVEQGWHHTGLTQLVEVESMHQRKKTMADLSDAIIALPQQSAQLTGYIEINGIYLCARSTIYAYGIYLVHHLATSFFRYRHKGT